MTTEIGLVDEPNYIQPVSLDGVVYNIKIAYNVRDERWYFSLYQADGTPLLEGKKIGVGINMLAHHNGDSRFPAGGLYVIPRNLSNKEYPTRSNLHTSYLFYYFTAEEVKEIEQL